MGMGYDASCMGLMFLGSRYLSSISQKEKRTCLGSCDMHNAAAVDQ